MPINIKKAKAKCVDCGAEFIASLTISVWDFGHVADVGLGSGNLQTICAHHHDVAREWGEPNAAQHRDFDVYKGRHKIGALTVSSMGCEHRFIITGEKIRKMFHAEIRSMQESYFRR